VDTLSWAYHATCDWALVSEPGFSDFPISSFRDCRFLENEFPLASKLTLMPYMDVFVLEMEKLFEIVD
jgi:hypothetical protein